MTPAGVLWEFHSLAFHRRTLGDPAKFRRKYIHLTARLLATSRDASRNSVTTYISDPREGEPRAGEETQGHEK